MAIPSAHHDELEDPTIPARALRDFDQHSQDIFHLYAGRFILLVDIDGVDRTEHNELLRQSQYKRFKNAA